MCPVCLALAGQYKISRHEAEDVWQEVSMAVWKRLQQGPVEHIGAYVRQACRNGLLDHAKKQQKRAEIFFGDDQERYERHRASEPVFTEALDAKIREMLDDIRPIVTEHEARIFILRCQLGWRIKLVAETLQISEDAVKSAYQSGKRKLRAVGYDGGLLEALNPD
ncbi:RNA polymerase sigma factor [Streptomyces sp. SGAir0957]